MATVLEKIADHIVSRTSFSPVAMASAQEAVIDTIGCMLAGAADQAPQAVARAFSGQIGANGPPAILRGGQSSPSVAALINGTAAHCLDFDDNFHPARAHASAVLVPALLSIATADAAISGRQFLHAYLAGLEAQAAVGFGVNPSHYNRGWHGTSTVGCIGTAAGVAILLGLNATEIAQAMSIATSSAAGPKGQFGTPTKPLHAGMAARNAVEAALLAQAGMSGRLDILERPQGFLDLFGGEACAGWQTLSMGDSHIIETHGLVTKLHPCCASTHRAIDAARDLQMEYDFCLDDVLSIETKLGRSAVDNLAYPDPVDEMQARFSMQYCLATALYQGNLSLSDFTCAAIFRPEIRLHMPKISMSAYHAAQEHGIERLPHHVTIDLRDGRRLKTERLHATGSVAVPLTAAERRSKFADCLRWAGLRAEKTHEAFLNFEDAASLKEMLNSFERSTAP
ncbi:MmgE/PrpD family 2-methylcitrate dehydratase protein (plasmid) [Rhizobium etli 8C-3]|uniref:MmgE/PrpD family 2-methylcitrate dehydratase protein n=1 Tax=Rhizobium etli 8C-3 TaxID=538025 RepID=A0A1L5PCZ8_RHIET|nr:MmgE/PrpD family protein [Rhizobium etli]APO78049.1 MmgE/PrpD family 2-methylcitrate dehydratase protein [Rhizobium etli 8C-3]